MPPIGKLEVIPGSHSNDGTTVTVSVRKMCQLCNQYAVVHNVSLEGVKIWDNGKGPFVQNVFPTMEPADREVLITGTHPSCWDKAFPDDDDEDEWVELTDDEENKS